MNIDDEEINKEYERWFRKNYMKISKSPLEELWDNPEDDRWNDVVG